MALNKDYILYAIIAVGVFTVYMAVVHLFRSSRLQRRVRDAAAEAEESRSEEESLRFALLCEWLMRKMPPSPERRKKITASLAYAGIESPYALGYYLFFQRIVQPVLLLIGLAILFVAIRKLLGPSIMILLLLLLTGGLFLILGLAGTKMYVSNRKQKRQQILSYSFAEMLDLMLVCIEAGLGLDAALNRVCRELRDSHPVAAADLERTRLELTMLGDRVQALQNLADRTDIVPYKALAAALIQTEKFGTSLTDTLRVLSEEQRLARLYSAEQKAARIPVIITIPLILFIMPAFIMIIIAPPIIKVIEKGGIFGSATPAARDKARR